MSTSDYMEYLDKVNSGIEEPPITKEVELTIYTLIGPYNLLGKYRSKDLIAKMIEAYQVLITNRYTTEGWEYYLQDGMFKPDWLLEEFLKIWYYPTDYRVHSFGTYRDEKYQWITVIKQEDEEAYRIVDSIHSLIEINKFLPIW